MVYLTYMNSSRLKSSQAKVLSCAGSPPRARTAELSRLRRQRYARRIWPLGERVEFELVEHLITAFDLDEDAVDRVLDRFAGLDADVLRALGGDRLSASPIRPVRGAR